jgi:hypothetical protein
MIMGVSCRSSSEFAPPQNSAEPTLAMMLVADLGGDIIVENIDATLRRFDFIEELGGYTASIRTDESDGMKRTTIEFRVPHQHTARVAEILMNEIGEVTYINALAADVSVRNARLRRELATLEASLEEQSGSEMVETRDRIELLHDMIAFQQKRATFIFVTVHLIEAP